MIVSWAGLACVNWGVDGGGVVAYGAGLDGVLDQWQDERVVSNRVLLEGVDQ